MKKPRPSRAAPRTVPAAARAPTYDDLLAIARLVEAGSRFTEFRLRSGDIEVEVKRANGQSAAPAQAGAQSAPPAEIGRRPSAAPAAAGATSVPIPELPAGAHVIESPMVGTFYRAPEPGAKPFVEPGTKVKPDSVVCIIEVMKLLNSVEAGVHGTVTHVLAENAAMVAHGQALVAIRPER
jgi:acetyl-CoA carboxylase biotin carboxyl carrier protein